MLEKRLEYHKVSVDLFRGESKHPSSFELNPRARTPRLFKVRETVGSSSTDNRGVTRFFSHHRLNDSISSIARGSRCRGRLRRYQSPLRGTCDDLVPDSTENPAIYTEYLHDEADSTIDPVRRKSLSLLRKSLRTPNLLSAMPQDDVHTARYKMVAGDLLFFSIRPRRSESGIRVLSVTGSHRKV